MIASNTFRGGMEGREVSPSIAAPIDSPFEPFDRCKQSSFSLFPLPLFKALFVPSGFVGFDSTSKQGV